MNNLEFWTVNYFNLWLPKQNQKATTTCYKPYFMIPLKPLKNSCFLQKNKTESKAIVILFCQQELCWYYLIHFFYKAKKVQTNNCILYHKQVSLNFSNRIKSYVVQKEKLMILKHTIQCFLTNFNKLLKRFT